MPVRLLRRGRMAVVVALVVASSASVVSAAPHMTDRPDGPVDLPDPAALAGSGAMVEQLLAGVGLDAAWRSTTGLHPGARFLDVQYEPGDAASVVDLLTTAIEFDGAHRAHEAAVTELRVTALELASAREDERSREIDRNRADAHFRGMHALAQAAAIRKFASNDPSTDAILGLDGQALLHAQRGYELTAYTLDELFELRAEARADLDAAIAAHDRAVATREALETRHERLTEEVTALARDRRRLDDRARSMLPAAAASFALAAVPGQPALTPRALSAYLEAEAVMREVAPACHLSWRTIAAIGSIEGAHGQYGGRRLGLDGRPDQDILGLQLNGVAVDNYGLTVANMADTDQGRWDGDPLHDRAVGPMQFIPDTWSRWGRDGDGDGEADPQDLDDAALAAGAYLCNYGSLRGWDGWSTAVFGYNHAAAYVNAVQARLMQVQRLRLPAFEGDDALRQPVPSGAFVPLEPPPEEPPPGETPPGETPPGEAPPDAPPAEPAPPAPAPAEPAPPAPVQPVSGPAGE